MRIVRFRALLAVLAALPSMGCISFIYERVSISEPIAPAVWKPLLPGTQMQVCLDRLGAPYRVQSVTRGEIELIYRWYEQIGWGLRVSVSTSAPVSYNYRNTWVNVPALRLRFDSSCALIEIHQGLLADFVTGDARKQKLARFGEAKQPAR